jgi:hypothetical protein
MIRLFSISLLLFTVLHARGQKVDSIFFHLYTDSLKKGTYNYINVDGKYNDNRWLPLTAKEIIFLADAGRFEGNSLFVDSNFTGTKIRVKAVLRADTAIRKSISLFIKTTPDTEPLKTKEEVMQPGRRRRH